MGIAGLDPPVLRAGIMGLIAYIVLELEGKVCPRRVMMTTLILLLVFEPLSLVYDVGFQLSFMATLGILISLSYSRRYIIQFFLPAVFAAVYTLPISFSVFGQLHGWSIPANIIAEPLVALSMLLGVMSLSLGYFFPSTQDLLFGITYLPLRGIYLIADGLG